MKRQRSHNFFIQEHLLREDIVHGGVGNKDIEKLLVGMGFTPINFPFHYNFTIRAKLFRFLHFWRVLFSLPTTATVVFQSPLYARIHILLIRFLRKFRPHIKVICFVTDINGLKDDNADLLNEEIHFFRRLNLFIVHNQSMEAWLLGQHPGAKTAMIEFFDFPVKPHSGERRKSPAIAFAGYLDKSRFLSALHVLSALTFHIYGPRDSLVISDQKNVLYHGVRMPAALPQTMEGSFGLVWDGDSIDGLEGIFGAYNAFISPHKLSLYLLAGLPVIAHVHSGAAALIRKYKIGFTVNSLAEIHSTISKMTEEEYQDMRRNGQPQAARIATGDCLRSAFHQLGVTLSS